MAFLSNISYFLIGLGIAYILYLITFVFIKVRPVKTCMNCGGKDFERIKRNDLIKYMYPFLKIQHVWCRRCWERYYTFDQKWKDKR
jgi:hypothetical protein